jgi:protein gp37
MAKNSPIEWTDATWNPWYGCTKVSPGCRDCYMYREQKQYGGNPYDVRRSKTRFQDPLKWGDGRTILTCSWSDFFIDKADPWRPEAWEIIRQTPRHTYLVLTKRPECIEDQLPIPWPWAHVYLGVSIESQAYLWRADVLRGIPAATRFLSCEPLLEDLGTLDLSGVGWVIVGGESGPTARPMEASWVRSIRDQCVAADVPFFFKQWGGRTPKAGGDLLDGRRWQEKPLRPMNSAGYMIKTDKIPRRTSSRCTSRT